MARSLFGIIEWILLFLIVFAFAIRTSPVQTYLATFATDYLSEELGTKVSVEKLDIVFIDRVDLKGFLLLNQHQTDTIASVKSLLVNVDGLSSFANKIAINSVTLDGGVVKLEKEKATGALNLKFVIDYFKSNKKKKKKQSVPVIVENIYLNDIRFHYDNQLIEPTKGGMDYQHLLLSNVQMKAEDIKMKEGVITAKVHHLSAREKCGFQLDHFQALLKVSNHGVDLKKVNIKTPQSDLNSNRFQLLYTSYTQYKSFVDSVAFDADLQPSSVSFLDISKFAPQLTGMDQQVEIEGKFSKFVKDLKVENFILKTGNRTELRGTINLPDFRHLKDAFYHERIDYAYVDLKDLQTIKLPKTSSTKKIVLNPTINRLGHFEARDIRLDGIYSQFVVASDEIKTAIGSVNMDNGILFTHNPVNQSFLFSHSEASTYDVKINEFNLGKFLENSTVGIVDGTFFLSGEARSFSDIEFHKIEGNVNRFDLVDYSYSDILVKNTTFIDKILYAEVDVEDRNLLLNYKGTIDLNGEPKMDMVIDLDRALLGRLNITESDSTNLTAQIRLNTIGVNPNTMDGTAVMENIKYVDGDKQINVPNLTLTVNRATENDHFVLSSSLLNARADGKVNFNNIGHIIQDQLNHLFPGLATLKPSKHLNHEELVSNDHVDFNIEVIDISTVLAIFQPKLQVAPGTKIIGDYNASNRSFNLDFISDRIVYDGKTAKGIQLNHAINNDVIHAEYNIRSLSINDSITIDSLKFITNGNGDNLASGLTWNPGTQNASDIRWNTKIESESKMHFSFEPSFFAINNQHWDIEKSAVVSLDSTSVDVSGLRMVSGDQFISINGKVSKDDKDKIAFEVNEVDLNKLSQMVGLDKKLEGKLNGWGTLSNPYTNLTYMGDLSVKGLIVDEEEVGDVYVLSEWDHMHQKVSLSGDLIYRGVPTFQFKGTYDISKEKENLDFDLVFDQTNIAFANVFMDPLVVDDIKGFINGQLDVKGSISRPEIEGKVNLDNASAKIVMLGTSFSFNGPMFADKHGFYIDYMPISDAEGNTGALTGSIYHTDYKNWNFDVAININEGYYRRDNNNRWVKNPLDRFLVLNTDASKGDVYYGKAYGLGTVGIFGYLGNLDINVNLKTQRGTAVNLSLFGQSELSEDNFIEFKPKDSTVTQQEKKIDFTGVSLNLNFDVTTDAQLKLIFNEQTGDEITAVGDGKLGLKLDNLGQMQLDGTYFVRDGSKYNFVLGPIKETFHIADGGSITWTGNPYEANLNIQAYYKIRANLGELSPELLTSGNQEVNCYLNLSESLMRPTIEFDIKAPKAPEPDKALLTQLTSDKDEMNRQFFSLLLWKKFQPMKGSSRASGGAALDLATNQINSLLSQVSQDYKLNVDMNSDVSGGSEYAVGVEKGFLDDQLIISGSFGTRNSASGNGNGTQSSLIGDIELEYKLNKDGTFRINVFNESNDNRGLQSNNRGQFKQGIGIYYKESFNNFKDFKLLQQFLDIFRPKSKKRYPIRRKRQQTPIPKAVAIVEENETH